MHACMHLQHLPKLQGYEGDRSPQVQILLYYSLSAAHIQLDTGQMQHTCYPPYTEVTSISSERKSQP